MDFVSIFAKDKRPEVFSVIFNRKELLLCGAEKSMIDVEGNMSEFAKLFDLWRDPLYLADFFDDNQDFFNDSYWSNINQESFISDVVISSRYIYKELLEIFECGELSNLFIPLDRASDRERLKGVTYKLKAKFGFISNRIAFRIYGVNIDGIFCVTGGAIKITKTMQEEKHTIVELNKMKLVCSTLSDNGVFDEGSFMDFIME